MKNFTLGIFAVLGLGTLVLVGCNKNENNIEENNNLVVEKKVDNLGPKTSLTVEDLDAIDDVKFPKSYVYSVYNFTDNEPIDGGEYVYPANVDHSLLIPEYATMASREIVSSAVANEMIYTSAKLTQQDGSQFNVLYINDPDTLKYIMINVENGENFTSYQFMY